MKILLIRPKPQKETIGLQSVMICEPLELMILTGVLKKNGHDVVILDMILEKKPLPFHIKAIKPDLIGITGYISHISVMKNYAKIIKEINPKIQVAVGGVHAEVCPQDFQNKNIDFICRSAEEFYAIAHCEDCSKTLPFRELPEKYMAKYYYLFQDRCALIKTSFGCPYNCNFCFCKEITTYSARTVDDVISELLTIKQKEVYIVDDDFLFNEERLLEFYEKIKENKIEKNFLVYGRADFIANHENIIEKLREIGLSAVIVGIEAASQNQLDTYNKKSKLEDNENAVRILQKYKIECYATIILGNDWDKSDFKYLYQYISGLNLVFVNLQPFTPMPGTGYFQEYEDRLIIPYEAHEKWDMAHLVIKPTKLTIRQYYWEIVKLYYKITIQPKNVLYMWKKYSFLTTMKLSKGAFQVTLQYLKKILRGE